MLQAANSYRFWAYLQLIRPANILTAWADILVGYAASGDAIATNSVNLVAWLLLATTGLYGGGVVFNDVFDAELDAKERPERPIPSGRASRQGAIWLGSLLLVVGIVSACQVSWVSAILAVSVAFAALVYDALGKHHPVIGPINMGICRGGNLLLGLSIVPSIVKEVWFLALIPLVYIAAVTTISRDEVDGGRANTVISALLLVGAVIGAILTLEVLPDYQLLPALPFMGLFAGRVLPPLVQAAFEPRADNIRKAVKAGVLSLIVLDATIAAGFAGASYGLLVLSLLPISMMLAQLFAVT